MNLAVFRARRGRTALIGLVALVALIIASGWTATQALAAVANCLGSGATFAGGDGSPANPYGVATQSQLAAINLSTYRSCTFLQTQDIALTGSWTPIGNSGSPFYGNYDGGDHVITGLSVSTGDSYLGLFGYAAGATFRNLQISGSVNIPSGYTLGGLLGKAEPETLIENVHSAVNVSGGSSIGGLVGWAVDGSSISRSSSNGDVTGVGEGVGGLVGFARGNDRTTTISDSYATGTVTGPVGYPGIAGLLGYVNEEGLGVRVSNSYATGRVTGGTGSREQGMCPGFMCQTIFGTTGGLVALFGYGRSYGNFLAVTNSFWDTQTSGRSSTADDKGTGLTTSQMKSYTTYANAGWTIVNGWAASGTWGICDGSTYPFLLSEYSSSPCTAAPAAPTGLVATPGDGSASIAFTLGADNGAAITNLDYSIDDGATWRTRLGPATSPLAITGLTNGTAYQVKLRAINSVGNGTPSSAVSVTPAAAPTPTPDPTPTPTPTPDPTPTPTPDPSNKFVTLPVDATNSALQSTLVVSDPGIATQKGTFIYSSGARSARRLTACTGSRTITKAGRYKINCTLTAGARSARRRGAIRVTLTTTFTPTGGTARSVTRNVTLKKTSSGVTG